MSALHIADTGLFVAMGHPSNSRYKAVRRFARRNDITFVLPERVYEGLTVDDPERDDPREMLTQEQLGEVNSEAMRMDEKLEQWSRAAISRRLAQAVVDGTSVMSAVLRVFEALQTAPGRVVPIGEVEGLSRQTVSIEGLVTKLWTPESPAIAQAD